MTGAERAALLAGFGRRVTDLRRRRDLTVRQLAAAADVDPGRLAGIEGGVAEADAAAVFRLADALGVPLAALFDDDAGTGQ